MSTTTLPVSVRARIVEIEKGHADVNWSTVNHFWKHEGLTYKDALHAEELERELDRLDALAAAVGLSEEQRAERNQVAAELDRFVQAATCHAEKQSERSRKPQAEKQQERTEAPPIEAGRTSNVVTVCTDSEARMQALLHLTTPAGFDPACSVEQVAAYEWEFVFHSITEASRFEQLCAEASRLATA